MPSSTGSLSCGEAAVAVEDAAVAVEDTAVFRQTDGQAPGGIH